MSTPVPSCTKPNVYWQQTSEHVLAGRRGSGITPSRQTLTTSTTPSRLQGCLWNTSSNLGGTSKPVKSSCEERIGALLVQASRLCATATSGEAAPSASETPNILGICSHLHDTMAMVAVREHDQHDAHEYLQNLYGNLAWGAAHLQNLLEWAESQGGNPSGESSTKKPRNSLGAATSSH